MFSLFFELTRRVLAFVLLIMGIRFIRIHLNTDVVTKSHPYRMGQRCGKSPIGPFKIKIQFSVRVIVNATGRIISIRVFCPISMGRRMRRRSSFYYVKIF